MKAACSHCWLHPSSQRPPQPPPPPPRGEHWGWWTWKLAPLFFLFLYIFWRFFFVFWFTLLLNDTFVQTFCLVFSPPPFNFNSLPNKLEIINMHKISPPPNPTTHIAQILCFYSFLFVCFSWFFPPFTALSASEMIAAVTLLRPHRGQNEGQSRWPRWPRALRSLGMCLLFARPPPRPRYLTP